MRKLVGGGEVDGSKIFGPRHGLLRDFVPASYVDFRLARAELVPLDILLIILLQTYAVVAQYKRKPSADEK